ncbi:MAG: hypothetical protein ACOCV2_04785 [Persicimonas sp.]
MRLLRDNAPILGGMVAILVAVNFGCSMVQFEQSPYSARDLAVVYSEQEDVTFLSWKLGEEVEVDDIVVELYQEDEYRPVELDRAPFPAEPYACGSGEICLQYQVDGRLELVDGQPPIRITHEHVWDGPEAELREVDQTFDIEPWPVERNEAVDPHRYDWFEENDVELERDYQYQVVGRGDECDETSAESWRGMERPNSVDYAWVEGPSCFVSRPDRRDEPGVEVARPIEPIPELYAERQTYEPETSEAPVIYAMLFDLQIASQDRCDRATDRITGLVEDAIEDRDPDAEQLGIYLPITSDGVDEIDNCLQESRREYPVSTMLRDAEIEVGGRHTRVIWVYVNNAQIPPNEDLLMEFAELERGHGEEEPSPFFWGIGHEWMNGGGGLDVFTGWRPIDEDTFESDITTAAEQHFPFLTMEHDLDTEVPISQPEKIDEARYFKLCTAEPSYAAIGDEPGEEPQHDATSPAIEWPGGEQRPFYTVDLGEQELVSYDDYEYRRVETVVEACRRFCDQPFRTGDGEEYDSWIDPGGSRPQEVCQWSE